MAASYLYKILDQPPPDPLPETLPATDLDRKDGFIHLSTAEQTPITAKLFFSKHSQLWIMILDAAKLDGRLEFSTDPKAGIEDGCAHVHESRIGLGANNVLRVVEVHRKDEEDWTEVEGMQRLSQRE